MIRLFKRQRHVASRPKGSRRTPQPPSSCTLISSTASPLVPQYSLDDIHLDNAPRHMPRFPASIRPIQNGKPHSAAHADRGFLHGWLCDAKRHPKPFTVPDVQADIASAWKRMSLWDRQEVGEAPHPRTRYFSEYDIADEAAVRQQTSSAYVSSPPWRGRSKTPVARQARAALQHRHGLDRIHSPRVLRH